MQIETGVDLSKKTSFGIGGKAKTVYYPETVVDLLFIPNYSNCLILSGATNVLINDTFCGDVISMSKFYTETTVIGDFIKYVKVGAGMRTQELVSFLIEERLTGLEFLLGVPGLVGGAVVMNSGTNGRSISEFIRSVDVVDGKGNLKTLCKDLHNDDLKFGRRYSILQEKKYIVLSVTFELVEDHRYAIRDKTDFYEARREDLPKGKSAGGIFVNHHILRKYSFDSLSVGDAHLEGNFIINRGNATAQDVLNLIKEIRSRVKEKLELEIKLVGF